MRIISGELKGRRLTALKGTGIRPTSDKVKEAIFSMVQPVIENATCLDLFAGAGSLGIEALSRGAARVYFCDIDPASLAALRQNLDECRVDGRRAIIIAKDWRQAIAGLREKCNLVFIDAPYEMCDYYSQILETLVAQSALTDNAIVVLERDSGASGYALHAQIEKVREKRYGGIGVDLLYYTKAGGENEQG